MSVEGLRITPLTEAPHNPQALFHHRLRPYQHRWSLISTDRWVNDIVAAGYTIPFISVPPPYPSSLSLFRDPSYETLLQQEVSCLLSIGAVERVLLSVLPHPEEVRGLETYPGPASTQPSLAETEIQDGYIGLYHPCSRQRGLVCFPQLEGCLFPYNDPFGPQALPSFCSGHRILPVSRVTLRPLSSSAGVLQDLSSGGCFPSSSRYHNFPYLDNCLLKAPTFNESARAVATTTTVFNALGLIINFDKSSLTPSHNLEFIGTRVDAQSARVYLPTARFELIRDLLQTVSVAPRSHILTCLQLLRHMAATTYVVSHARLYLCGLQHWLFTVYTLGVHSTNETVYSQARQDFANMVGQPQKSSSRGPLPWAKALSTDHSGCFLDWLGCPSARTSSSRALDTPGIPTAHKFP